MAFDLSIFTTLSRPFANLWHRYLKGIDNPFYKSGCEYLLYVCRSCLCSVAWFSYWFDNFGFISERNTYRRCVASSLPLWGNTDVASSDITEEQVLAKHQEEVPLPSGVGHGGLIKHHRNTLVDVEIADEGDIGNGEGVGDGGGG